MKTARPNPPTPQVRPRGRAHSPCVCKLSTSLLADASHTVCRKKLNIGFPAVVIPSDHPLVYGPAPRVKSASSGPPVPPR
jgi:hypothetical protein